MKLKVMILKPRRTVLRAIPKQVFHRDFLGEHRYTTRGGIARPAGDVLRTAVVCLRQPRGDATLPLRCARHTYPIVYFASDEALKSRASPSTKSALSHRQDRVLSQRQKPLSDATMNLAKMEVLSYNKRDLERMLQNERSQREHEINRTRRTDHSL